MKFITRDTDYALRALIFMARAFRHKGKKVVSVEEIALAEKLPRLFLRRILQRLAGKRVLSSYKGKSGGFSFLMPVSKIRLTHIIRIFQGNIDITNCLLKNRICPNKKTCALRRRLKAIDSMIVKELNKVTVARLLGEQDELF